MCGKRAQVRLNRLLVADVRKNMVENAEDATLARCYRKTALRHEAKQAYSPQNHCLAACVRACYRNAFYSFYDIEIQRHDTPLAALFPKLHLQKRMPRVLQLQRFPENWHLAIVLQRPARNRGGCIQSA